MIMTVEYKVIQGIKLDDKFDKSQDSMSYAEQDRFLIEVMDALKEKLPPHANITYVGNGPREEILFTEEWD